MRKSAPGGRRRAANTKSLRVAKSQGLSNSRGMVSPSLFHEKAKAMAYACRVVLSSDGVSCHTAVFCSFYVAEFAHLSTRAFVDH
jgi:hypothetical protein